MPQQTLKKVKELQKIADTFTQRGCVKTGNIINSLANDVGQSKPISDKKYQSILSFFRKKNILEEMLTLQ